MVDMTRPPGGGAPALSQHELALASSEASFFQRVYTWMFAGLLTTAAVSLLLSRSDAWLSLLTRGNLVFFLIIGVQIGLVVLISAKLDTLQPAVLKALFLLYAASLGLTISLLLRVYPGPAFFKAFLSTTGIYGAMAVYGLVTKRSLQAWGAFLFMGMVGVFIALIVNMFIQSSAMDFVICVIGVLVFAGLTAYDHQKLRVIHAGGFADSDMESRVVIMGALHLFIDFVEIFMFLLRLFANRD